MADILEVMRLCCLFYGMSVPRQRKRKREAFMPGSQPGRDSSIFVLSLALVIKLFI